VFETLRDQSQLDLVDNPLQLFYFSVLSPSRFTTREFVFREVFWLSFHLVLLLENQHSFVDLFNPIFDRLEHLLYLVEVLGMATDLGIRQVKHLGLERLLVLN